MTEITWLIDRVIGSLLVEGLGREEASALAGDLLPPGQEMGCAHPLSILPPPTTAETAMSLCVRIAGYYHNSLVEGPGRRSTVKFQGCPIRCHGCLTPDSWDPEAGTLVPVDRLAGSLLDPMVARDGISIVGGEPFAQPEALWALVQALQARDCVHILVYSGYTYERLRRMAEYRPVIGDILEAIDLLIDGPFVEKLADGAGLWTGSRNQRVIDLVATRRAGRVMLLRAEPWDTCS